jgi:ankyrin repeat protein
MQNVIIIKLVLNRKDMEGILPIQYAVLFGNNRLIEYFLSKEASTDIKLEGIPLLHLSLSFSSNYFLI